MVIGCLMKVDARDIINLANTRVPRYTATTLFPQVTAHTLGEIGLDG